MKFTVLIPTLGERPKELVRLLDSIISQLYNSCEIIIVSQDNHDVVAGIIKEYSGLDILHIKIEQKGLSHARNVGIAYATGDIVVLSDDDCWYTDTAFKQIYEVFQSNKQIDICLTKAFDKDNSLPYKTYPKRAFFISNRLQLLSKTSFEIAYKRETVKQPFFDESFGLGADFVCGEEVDFLIRNLKKGNILYVPQTTVYHPKKETRSDKRILAKGALYKKHFNIVIGLMVLARDFIVKKQNNFVNFFKGYYEYSKRKD